MEGSNDTARWAAIANALSSPTVKSQAAVWELERRQMLDIVRKFWTAEERNFRSFADNPANSDALDAMVVTSLEDMPEVRFKLRHIRIPNNCLIRTIPDLLILGICWCSDWCLLP